MRVTDHPHLPFIFVLVIALSLHLLIYGDGLNPDATNYMRTTYALFASGSMELPTQDYPRHPPLMAIMFAPFAVLAGFNQFAVHTLELTFFAGDLILLYLLSLRRLGPWFALAPQVLLSLDPVLYLNMSEGRSLAPLIFFSLITLWGIWRALEKTIWLSVAAVGASLAFLTADTAGYLFVVAAIAGLVWRFYYARWQIFVDRGFLLAAVIFSSTVLGWTAYNLATIGSPYTDPRVVGYLNRLLLETPLHVAIVIAGGLAFYFLLYLSQTGWPFLLFREGRRSLAELRIQALHDQRLGALLLFMGIATIISAIVSAAFLLYEPLRSLNSVDTYLRYAGVVAPMAYLAVGMHIRSVASRVRPRARWVIPFVIAVVILAPQFSAKVAQGHENGETFVEIARILEARGYQVVYTDVVSFLQYNVPSATFLGVNAPLSVLYVNLTTADVPMGSPVMTHLLIPKAYDEYIGGFYLVDHFDPNVNSPFLNLLYGA